MYSSVITTTLPPLQGKLKNSEQENTRLAKEIHDTKELLSKHKEENLSLTTKVDSLTAQVFITFWKILFLIVGIPRK